jgi:REP element-mobilizing transposase RayT
MPQGEEMNSRKKVYLPHVDLDGYYQFVTFRTHDSIDDFLKRISDDESISVRLREYRIDEYLDNSSRGAYLNGQVLDYLRDFFISKDKSLYDLVAFAIMPNHVHILFKQQGSLSKTMQILKGSSSITINRLLNRKGKFWEVNYHDRAIRDENHFFTVYNYIENNPIKANLKDSRSRFYGIY